MKTKTIKILTMVMTIALMIAMSASVVQTFGQNIMGVIQVLGVVIAVVVLMVLGIKYMMGSAEEKAEYKKTMIPYLVGAILIFAASTIANVVYQFAIGL